MVTRAESDGFKEDQKHTLAVLKKLIDGSGYTIGSLMFTTVEDLISYCHRHFTRGSYDCIVRLIGLMGSITDVVVSQDSIER